MILCANIFKVNHLYNFFEWITLKKVGRFCVIPGAVNNIVLNKILYKRTSDPDGVPLVKLMFRDFFRDALRIIFT